MVAGSVFLSLVAHTYTYSDHVTTVNCLERNGAKPTMYAVERRSCFVYVTLLTREDDRNILTPLTSDLAV